MLVCGCGRDCCGLRHGDRCRGVLFCLLFALAAESAVMFCIARDSLLYVAWHNGVEWLLVGLVAGFVCGLVLPRARRD